MPLMVLLLTGCKRLVCNSLTSKALVYLPSCLPVLDQQAMLYDEARFSVC